MLRAISISAIGVLLLSCIITPAVYTLCLHLMPAMNWPYSRVFDRVVLFWAVVFIAFFRRSFEISKLKVYFACGSKSENAADFFLGFLITLVTSLIALYFIIETKTTYLSWAGKGASDYIVRGLRTIPAAIVISLIEESFFRVLIFQKLRERMPLLLAILICSLIYAVIHFFSPDRSYIYPGWSPLVGFDYLGILVSRLFIPGVMWGVFGLILVGSVLCYAIYKTGSIFLCVGLHAGWITAIKVAFVAAVIQEGQQFPLGVGRRYFLVTEELSWLSIVVVFLILYLLKGRKASSISHAV